MKSNILSAGLVMVFAITACTDVTDDGNGNTTTDTMTAMDTATSNDAAATNDVTTGSDTAMPDTAMPAEDTNVPQEDTSTPQEQGLLCPAIFQCVNTEMQKICPATGATQECQTQAINTCVGMADTQQEGQWFQNSLGCQIGCLQQNGGYNEGAFTCMREQCLQAQADCYSGAVYGAAGCGAIDGCAQGCQLDSTFSCLRSCFQASTLDASLGFHDINLCAQAACVDKLNTPQFEPCAQEALGQGGACEAEVSACVAN